MNEYLLKMSYFNAAESPQWSLESEDRSTLKIAAQVDIFKWLADGLELDTLKEFVRDNAGLCTFTDFITDTDIKEVLGADMKGVLQ